MKLILASFLTVWTLTSQTRIVTSQVEWPRLYSTADSLMEYKRFIYFDHSMYILKQSVIMMR